jgi:dynein heavy chain
MQVRKYMHIVLCFSPVGDKFRIRARQFPALVNCTMFDWFHGWPGEALVSVAQRFLADVPALDEGVRDNLAYHMAYAHQCVSEASERFKEAYRRYNYTTPKSYLELISLYKQLLSVSKHAGCHGLQRAVVAGAQVAALRLLTAATGTCTLAFGRSLSPVRHQC